MRTTIMLPPELKTRAEHRAAEIGISRGELIRRALQDQLERRPGPDPLWADDAVFTGPAPRDLAAEHDEHLSGPAGDLR